MRKNKEKPVSKMTTDELVQELAESAFVSSEDIRVYLIRKELELRRQEEKDHS